MQPTPSITASAPTGGRRLAIPPPPPRRPLAPGGQPATPEPQGPLAAAPDCVTITPWIDPVVDETGHDPRSSYVERFWLSTLGPTATWLLRRLVDGFDEHPDGYILDLAVTAQSLGLTYSRGQSSPFAKAFHRCVMFGLAHHCSTGYVVRRRVPDVARRHLLRMPDELRLAHEAWLAESATCPAGVSALGTG